MHPTEQDTISWYKLVFCQAQATEAQIRDSEKVRIFVIWDSDEVTHWALIAAHQRIPVVGLPIRCHE
jgi:hypothetical protein